MLQKQWLSCDRKGGFDHFCCRCDDGRGERGEGGREFFHVTSIRHFV